MNVYVMTDIEGISGIYTRDQVLPSESRFQEGRRYIIDGRTYEIAADTAEELIFRSMIF